jgi:hypothetical protein
VLILPVRTVTLDQFETYIYCCNTVIAFSSKGGLMRNSFFIIVNFFVLAMIALFVVIAIIAVSYQTEREMQRKRWRIDGKNREKTEEKTEEETEEDTGVKRQRGKK